MLAPSSDDGVVVVDDRLVGKCSSRRTSSRCSNPSRMVPTRWPVPSEWSAVTTGLRLGRVVRDARLPLYLRPPSSGRSNHKAIWPSYLAASKFHKTFPHSLHRGLTSSQKTVSDGRSATRCRSPYTPGRTRVRPVRVLTLPQSSWTHLKSFCWSPAPHTPNTPWSFLRSSV